MSDLCPACGHPKHYERERCGCLDMCGLGPCPCTYAQAAKADAGKPRYDLIPPEVIRDLAMIYTYGVEKYAEDSWRKVPDGLKRYRRALLGHLVDYLRGEWLDSESGKPHLDHALWNVVAVRELEREKRGES